MEATVANYYEITIFLPNGDQIGHAITDDLEEDWLALAVHKAMLPVRRFYASMGSPIGEYSINVKKAP
jgi:hypothetical protein